MNWLNSHATPQEKELQEITQHFLKKKLFVMLRHPFKNENAQAYFLDHLKWMIDLEKQGIIFGSGPFVDSKATAGKPGSPAGGMTILRAASLEAAVDIVQTDPYVVHEIVTFEMKEWLVMEGGFNLRVSFSQGSYVID